MKTLYTTTVIITSGRDGAIRSDDERLVARLAFPKALGGDGAGTNPEQLFAAGYGACFGSTVATLAKAEGLALQDIEVRSEVDLTLDGSTYGLGVRLAFRARGAEREVLTRLVEKAKAVCPYARAIRDNVTTTVTILD